MKVMINDVTYVPTIPPRGTTLEVGDFVAYIGPEYRGLVAGALGKVIEVYLRPSLCVAVEFSHWFEGGHDCMGASVDKHGRFFYPNTSQADESVDSLCKQP